MKPNSPFSESNSFLLTKTPLFINTMFCPIMKHSKTLLEPHIRAKFNSCHEEKNKIAGEKCKSIYIIYVLRSEIIPSIRSHYRICSLHWSKAQFLRRNHIHNSTETKESMNYFESYFTFSQSETHFRMKFHPLSLKFIEKISFFGENQKP